MAVRFYYNPGPTLPSTVIRLADIRNASGTAARVELSASNQIFIQNNAGTTVTTFAHALQANTWYRIELAISASSSAATINAAYYLLDSTTPVDPAYTTTTGNTGAANITQVTVGSTASATWTGTSYFDDIAAQSPSTAFIGPVVVRPDRAGCTYRGLRGPGDGQATVSLDRAGVQRRQPDHRLHGDVVAGWVHGDRCQQPADSDRSDRWHALHLHCHRDQQRRHRPASAASTPVTPVAAATAPGCADGCERTAGDGQATVSWTAPSNGGARSPATR